MNFTDISYIVVDYSFAGIGSFNATIPEGVYPEFEAWVNSSGSAFLGDNRPATEEEIKNYIALNADNE